MIHGICEILGESLADDTIHPLSIKDFGRFVKQHILDNDCDKDRIKRHQRRQEFYQDGGHHHVEILIDKVIKDRSVQELRKQWVEICNFNNLVKRIVNERSTVYSDQAVRTVSGQTNKNYQRLQLAMRQSEKARQWNRLANLHRTIFVQVRVRNIGTQINPIAQPVFDIVTPAECAGIITSPKDPTKLEGVVVQIGSGPVTTNSRHPAFVVWTNKEKIYLNNGGSVMSVEEHGIGRMPIVMLRLEEDSAHGLWPGMAGEDLISAQLALSFAQVCLLKEMKSSTKVPVLQGDTTMMARSQASDTEMPVELPDGAVLNVADMGMDLGVFRDTANHIAEVCASNYGLSPSVLRHQGVQSAQARDLMRVPIRELRLEQQAPLREFERELALVQSLVMQQDAPEYAFAFKDWQIDFADPQTPRGVKEQLEEFEHARRLRLTSTYKHISQQNPDLDKSKAREQVIENVADELDLNVLMRPLAAVSGMMGQVSPTSTGANTSDDDSEGRQQSAADSRAIGEN